MAYRVLTRDDRRSIGAMIEVVVRAVESREQTIFEVGEFVVEPESECLGPVAPT